jgi:hypothetical protein
MAPPSKEPLAVFPSLLVFGPQAKLPSPEDLAELRQKLIETPRLNQLVKAIKDLQRLWETLTRFDPSLSQVPGAECLVGLQQWLNDGVFPQYSKGLPNVSALPLTVILQILLYLRYLDQLQISDAQRHVLQQIKAGGAQGFCVGFLSAIVISCSGNA